MRRRFNILSKKKCSIVSRFIIMSNLEKKNDHQP